MGTLAVTGSASGIGAATARKLTDAGHTVIGVDRRDADVCCDLGTAQGRATAVEQVAERCDGVLDGLVTSAGVAGSGSTDAAVLVSVNYFGTVELLEGLRECLGAAPAPAVVCLSSNSTTCQPNWPVDLAEACLRADEVKARALGAEHGSVAAYPATKAAIAWYVRSRSGLPEWAGRRIRLNAVAPGLIDTPMTEQLRQDPELGGAIEAFPTPRGNPGTPVEVASVIEFLLGPCASLLYGSVVFADGGTDAQLRPRDWPATWVI